MRPLATFSFLIFLTTFQFLHSPRYSFLLAPPSPSSLFLPRLAMSKSLRIHKRQFFIDFDESVTDGRKDGPTNGPTNRLTDGPMDGQTVPLKEIRRHI